jgi:hypothetical protein
MKNILTLKNKYYEEYLAKIDFSKKDEEELEKYKNSCRSVAEVRAFIDTLINEEYRNLSIFDFNGETKSKKRALEPKEATRAKNQICKYIWGYSWEELKNKFAEEDKIKEYISHNSVLMRRLETGSSVAIYGGKNGPCGRTMCASIILKEAIKMRLFVPNIVSHIYDWVDFQMLTKYLIDDSLEVADCRTADWLVVDNIYCPLGESLGQKAFRANLLDPFFTYRLRNNLPTILVFQYDIRSATEPLYKTLGTGVSSIVNSTNVCRIPLSKRS